MASELSPVELETELDKTLRGDQGAAQRIIDHHKVLRQRVGELEQQLTDTQARIKELEKK